MLFGFVNSVPVTVVQLHNDVRSETFGWTKKWFLSLKSILIHFWELVVLNCNDDPHWQLNRPPISENFCRMSFMAALMILVASHQFGCPISSISSCCNVFPLLWSSITGWSNINSDFTFSICKLSMIVIQTRLRYQMRCCLVSGASVVCTFHR